MLFRRLGAFAGPWTLAAAEAGAAILHLHARSPVDGSPSPRAEDFMAFLPRIKQATDAVINVTTGGGLNMTVEDRLAAPLVAKPEMCSLNMGSINFGLYPIKDRVKQFQYDWEEPYLEGTRGGIFRNTFLDIETFLRELGEAHGTRFEFECYDIGHVYNLAHFLDRGLIEPPIFVQSIFGILGGIGTDPEDLLHMRRTLDRLIGRENYIWSILGAGRHQTNLVTMGAIMGGNTRVGLEDNIYLEKGKLAESNADQVAKIAVAGAEKVHAASTAENYRRPNRRFHRAAEHQHQLARDSATVERPHRSKIQDRPLDARIDDEVDGREHPRFDDRLAVVAPDVAGRSGSDLRRWQRAQPAPSARLISPSLPQTRCRPS